MAEQQLSDEESEKKNQFLKQIEQRNQSVPKMRVNDKLVNGVSLDFNVAFGINYKNISNQLQIVSDGLVVFCAGNTIVVRDINARMQHFIYKENRLKNVTALFADQDSQGQGNIIVAAGESSTSEDKPVTISVASVKKPQWYILTNPNLKGYVKLIQFNHEKKFLVSLVQQSGGPSNNMLVLNFWNYEQEKLCASAQIKNTFDKFTMHPSKPKNLILSGSSYLKMWEAQFTEHQIKELTHLSLVSLKQEKENKFLDQTWVFTSQVPTLLVLAAGNKIFVLQNEVLKKIIDIDTSNMSLIQVNVVEEKSEEVDEIYDVNSIIENMIKEKDGKIGNSNVIKLAQQTGDNKNNQQPQVEFNCITQMRGGFLIGGNKGILCQYMIEKSLSAQITYSFQMKLPHKNDDNKIIYLCSSTNDNIISIVSLAGKQNQQLYFSMLNTYSLDNPDISAIQPFFPTGFHTKRINNIACSACKSIFATCSQDNTVKLWNYYESDAVEKKGILSHQFKEEPQCISLHPSGLFLAIAFINCFQIYCILSETLYLQKEIQVTNCRIVKFSNGGQYLIANEKSNILIFQTISYEQCMPSINWHINQIKEICISEDDQTIVSCDTVGSIYCTNINYSEEIQKNDKIRTPNHNENSVYNCIQYSQNKDGIHDYFVGASQDKYLCIYKQKCNELVAEFPTVDCYITTLLVSNKLGVIFMGTNKGTIRVALWPISDETLLWEYVSNNKVMYSPPQHGFEIQAHATAVTAIALSHDYQFLFSGAEDGTLYVFRIKDVSMEGPYLTDYQQQQPNNEKKSIQNKHRIEERIKLTAAVNDLYLCQLQKLNEKNELIKKLQFEVIKSEQTIKYELQKQEQQFQHRMSTIDEEFKKNLKQDQDHEDQFKRESNEKYEALVAQYRKERSQFDQEIEDLKKIHQHKINFEVNRNQSLEEEIERLKEDQKEKMMKYFNQHKEDLKKIRNVFQDKCERIQVKYSDVVSNAKNFGNAFISRLDKQDQEHEKELDEQIKELKDEITEKKAENEKLELKNKQLIQSNEQLQKKEHDLQKQFNDLLAKHNRIKDHNLENDQNIVKMQHQLLERIQVIDSKEETCKAARDEQINLENFRYMLDQKIKMLQNDKKKMLGKINEKELSLKNMFNELIKESNENQKKYQEYNNYQGEIEVLDQSLKKIDLEIFINSNILHNFQSSLLKIIKTPDRMAPMAQKLKDMIATGKDTSQLKKITNKKDIKNKDINEIMRITNEKGNDINDELLKQGKWMNKKLWLIEETCKKLKEIREENIEQILTQNTKLIEECNTLRSENEKYQKLLKNEEKKYSDLIKKRQKLLKKKKEQSPLNMNKLMKKYQDSNEQLKSQSNQINSIKDSMNELLLKSDSEEEEQNRLPPISNKKNNAMSSQDNTNQSSTEFSIVQGGRSIIKIDENQKRNFVQSDIVQEAPIDQERAQSKYSTRVKQN